MIEPNQSYSCLSELLGNALNEAFEFVELFSSVTTSTSSGTAPNLFSVRSPFLKASTMKYTHDAIAIKDPNKILNPAPKYGFEKALI